MSRGPGAVERSSCCHRSPAAARLGPPPAAVLTCTPISSASTGKGRSACSSRCVESARARAMTWGGVARRPASHVRYDSGDTPSIAANAACDWPNAIRHSRSVQGSTTSHHAIGAGRCEARGWRSAYFSQPIVEGDRSLCSPVPSPPVPRQWAQSANSLGKWRARQDSNLRPLGLEGPVSDSVINRRLSPNVASMFWISRIHADSCRTSPFHRLTCDNRSPRRST